MYEDTIYENAPAAYGDTYSSMLTQSSCHRLRGQYAYQYEAVDTKQYTGMYVSGMSVSA